MNHIRYETLRRLLPPMQEDRSFQALIRDLRSGQDDAAERIVNEYTSALVAVARKQIGPRLSRRVDPEDVVQSTYRSLFVRARDGEYELGSGRELWKLLVTMTLNKVRRKAKFNSTDRRNMMLETSALAGETGSPAEFTDLSGPSPEDAAELTDEIERLLGLVGDRERPIIELRLQGFSTAEIAEKLGRAERSVRRVLQHLREHLERDMDAS